MQRSLGSWSGVASSDLPGGRENWARDNERNVEMSGQAKLGLLPCKQGLAGSKPRQWGHYCCDGAVGEMVMCREE